MRIKNRNGMAISKLISTILVFAVVFLIIFLILSRQGNLFQNFLNLTKQTGLAQGDISYNDKYVFYPTSMKITNLNDANSGCKAISTSGLEYSCTTEKYIEFSVTVKNGGQAKQLTGMTKLCQGTSGFKDCTIRTYGTKSEIVAEGQEIELDAGSWYFAKSAKGKTYRVYPMIECSSDPKIGCPIDVAETSVSTSSTEPATIKHSYPADTKSYFTITVN